jgi:hypothetical protein
LCELCCEDFLKVNCLRTTMFVQRIEYPAEQFSVIGVGCLVAEKIQTDWKIQKTRFIQLRRPCTELALGRQYRRALEI